MTIGAGGFGYWRYVRTPPYAYVAGEHVPTPGEDPMLAKLRAPYHAGFATLKNGYATPSGHAEVAGMPRVTLSDGFTLEATRIEGDVVEARVRLAPAYTDRPGVGQAPFEVRESFKVHWQFEATFSVKRP